MRNFGSHRQRESLLVVLLLCSSFSLPRCTNETAEKDQPVPQAAVVPAESSRPVTHIDGEVVEVRLSSISASVSTVDGKEISKTTIDATLEVRDATGTISAIAWGNEPETKVYDTSGKAAVFGDIMKGARVRITAYSTEGGLTAEEVRLQDGP